MHYEVESEENGERDERHHPADQQHDRHAHQEPEQGEPYIVVLKRKHKFNLATVSYQFVLL